MPTSPCAIVWKPVLKDADSIRRAMLDANADDAVLGVITWMHTFSPAKMWIGGLSALTKPLLHLHTQANVELPWDAIDFDFMNLNQAAHGDREYAYIATRLGVARTTVAGHASNPVVARRVGTWVRAAAGRAATQSLRLARFGDNMRNVAVTEGDKTEAEVRFGVSVNTWGVNDLVDAIDRVSDERRRRARQGVRGAVRRGPRAARRRRPARLAAVRREPGARAAGPARRPGRAGVHDELRGPRRACASCPASRCSA